MVMTPLYWFIFGIMLLVFELATPGFVTMFFGMAALTVALLAWALPLGQVVSWLLFAALSVVYILLLRKYMKRVFIGDKSAPERLEDAFIGKNANVIQAIAPGKPGRIEFMGSGWQAESEDKIDAGERVKIYAKNNLTLFVCKQD